MVEADDKHGFTNMDEKASSYDGQSSSQNRADSHTGGQKGGNAMPEKSENTQGSDSHTSGQKNDQR